MEWLPSVSSIIISVIAGVTAGFSIAFTRRLQRRLDWANDNAEVALDILEQMEWARDPGRDVQNRLAAVMEATMISTSGDPDKPMPEARRAAAQTMAAQIMLDIRRADLVLAKKDPPDD